MPLTLLEWFGHDLRNWSPESLSDRTDERCPYINAACTKSFNDGTKSGACSVILRGGTKIHICPNRLYAENYSILDEVARVAFGEGHVIIRPTQNREAVHDGTLVVAFGQRYGRELQLPSRGGRGGYFVDWILARISPEGELADFVAVEVQTIDTTGSYKAQVEALKNGD